jgi:hypothetical protein
MWRRSHSTGGEVANRVACNHMWVKLASITCLQGYVRWDPFVLRAQTLDSSLLGLYLHNKMLLPTKLPQCPVSLFEIPATVILQTFLVCPSATSERTFSHRAQDMFSVPDNWPLAQSGIMSIPSWVLTRGHEILGAGKESLEFCS